MCEFKLQAELLSQRECAIVTHTFLSPSCLPPSANPVRECQSHPLRDPQPLIWELGVLFATFICISLVREVI